MFVLVSEFEFDCYSQFQESSLHFRIRHVREASLFCCLLPHADRINHLSGNFLEVLCSLRQGHAFNNAHDMEGCFQFGEGLLNFLPGLLSETNLVLS